jgi:ribosomal protein L36
MSQHLFLKNMKTHTDKVYRTAVLYVICELQPRACVNGLWQSPPQFGELVVQEDCCFSTSKRLLSFQLSSSTFACVQQGSRPSNDT